MCGLGLGSQTDVLQTMPMFMEPAADGGAAAGSRADVAAPASAEDAAWQEDFEREMILRLPTLFWGEVDEEQEVAPTLVQPEVDEVPQTVQQPKPDVSPTLEHAKPADVPPAPEVAPVDPQETADKKVSIRRKRDTPPYYRGSLDYVLHSRGVVPFKKDSVPTPVPELDVLGTALTAEAQTLNEDAPGMDDRDLRAEQLGMRASEIAKSKELKEQKKVEKEAAKEAAKLEPPKPRGRPRKSEVAPEAADPAAAAEPVAKRRRKKEAAEDVPAAEPAEPADLAALAEPASKRRKSGQPAEPKAKCKAKAKAKADAEIEVPKTAVPKAKAAAKGKAKSQACVNVQHAPVDSQIQAEMLELCSKFDNVVYDRTVECLHKFSGADWVRIDAYWSRQAIGVKIYYEDAWTQKWYFSLRSLPFCLNIYMAQKMATEVSKHEKDWHEKEECRNFEAMLRATAAAADAAYQAARRGPAV